jgi:hypothetical protein
MKKLVYACLVAFCSCVKPPAPPKRFYNPATAEDYEQAHRYLERNPEKPALKPQGKKPLETELYGPS